MRALSLAVVVATAATIACARTGEATPTSAPSGAAAAAPADARPPKEPTMAPLAPLDRYRDYLRQSGVDADHARIIEDGGLALGDFRFYRVDDPASGQRRAAASPAGLVAAGRRADDAWWALLGAGDASTVADRIAWLESTPDLDRHVRGRAISVVRPGTRPAQASIDPRLWRAAPAPTLHATADSRQLVAWFYLRFADAPYQLTVTAPAAGPATLGERPAGALVDVGDQVARATAALDGDDDDLVQWALLLLPARGATAAAPAIARLLGSSKADRRAAAAGALALLAAPDAVAPLAAAAATEADPIALTSELQALGHIKTAASARALAGLRGKVHSDRRVEIIHALAAIGGAAAADVRAGLADAAAHDPDPDLRALAASYLRDLAP